jgi:hypothetical protein
MPKLSPLPIIEHWDCQSCGLCCRDSIVPLDEEDVARLRGQKWDEHPDYLGIKTTVRMRILGGREVLAKKDDGSCVFLTSKGLCRIHELYGFDEKPKICRQFPLQPVPINGRVLIATRRSCPTAARGVGRPVTEYFNDLRKLLPATLDTIQPKPPAIINGYRRDWSDTLRVTDALEKMLCDTRYPLVRRIVHGLEFCNLLGDCKPRKLRKIDIRDFAELVRVATESAHESAAEWFVDRQPPKSGNAAAFRQAAAETMRLHPQLHSRETWRDRLRMLRIVLAITRGKGKTPQFVPELPQTDFADLERPLGALDLTLIRPLDEYFQTMTASLRYCTLIYKKWSVIDGFRALSLQFPIALWCWKWACGNQLDGEKLIPIIGCLDRTHTVSILTGWRHRRRVEALAATNQLQRLCAWYAR